MAPKVPPKERANRTKKLKKTKSVNNPTSSVDKTQSFIRNPNQYLRIKCPICFECIKKDAVSSTKCGHVFCTECLQKALKRMSLCPTCRTRLRAPRGHHPLYLDTTIDEPCDSIEDLKQGSGTKLE